MSKDQHDIDDNEIRIISSDQVSQNKHSTRQPKKPLKKIIVIAIVAAAILGAILWLSSGDEDSEENPARLELVTDSAEPVETDSPRDSTETDLAAPKGYVSISDTVVCGVELTLFTPVGLTPVLSIGTDVLDDTTAMFVVQAADVRGDNGGIVGAYVLGGELLGKGQAKAGFCAIVDGQMTVGVADSTPLLEKALENDGFFFRQYPLVVGNQIVENRPKGESLRKALTEINGHPVVVMSREPMTFHDFSQSLVDLGVSNAIYIVGGKSYGFAIGPNGEKTEFGRKIRNPLPNTNYLVWR
ncbi:MAG: phosphodiester glycosidase family protein [Clostridium sp.]|nr:phosphodiester glycosidase family protein [Clostridium sp.]